MGEHGIFQKHFLYDGAVRIPWIVRWPGEVPANKKIEGIVNQIDQIPTCLGFIGEKESLKGVAGRDRSQLIRSDKNSSDTELLYSEHVFPGIGHMNIVRSKRDKSCYFYMNKNEECYVEYYDIEKDPFEIDNRADSPESQERINYLCKKLSEWQCRNVYYYHSSRGDDK